MRTKISQVLMVSCLNCAKDVDGGNVGTGKRPIVHDLFDARTGRGDLRGKIGEAAGSVANYRSESAKSSVGDQATFDDATEDVGINVSAAKQ